jgi:hypothetical protein
MKASGQIKCASKHRITKSKCLTAILKVLIEAEENPKENCQNQLITASADVSFIHSMFSLVGTKIRRLQQHSVQCWTTSPINRHNTHRRPSHSNFNGWHKRLVKKCPQQSNKKNCFTYNKQNHSQMQTVFNFGGMTPVQTFTNNISPPDANYVYKTRQLE